MKKYERYKDSGVQWLGKVPEHWEVMPMKYVLSCNDEVLDEKTSPSTEINYVEISDVNSVDGICNSTKVLFGDAPSRARRIVQEGDVIISTVRTYLKAIAPVRRNGYIVSTGFAVLRPRSINSDYLSYAVLSNAFIDSVIACSTGVSYPAITSTDLIALPISIPSLAEQIAIANYLDSQVSKINSVITEKEKMINDMEKYRSSLISETVTKGLNPNAPMKNSGVDWIGEIPEHWSVTKAKYLVNISHGTDPKTEGDTPVYGSGSTSFKTCGEYKEGDTVLVGRKGATLHIPHYVTGKYWNVDTAFDVKVKDDYNLRYYYYNAICFDYKRYMSQTTLPGMTQNDYNNMLLPHPDSATQNKIVDYLDIKNRQIDSFISELNSQIEDLKSYKQSLITEAVTGQVDVRDWTPNE